MGDAEDCADEGGRYGGEILYLFSRGADNSFLSMEKWSFLTDFTSDPAIPTKLTPTNGSAKTLVGELCSFAALIAWHAFC